MFEEVEQWWANNADLFACCITAPTRLRGMHPSERHHRALMTPKAAHATNPRRCSSASEQSQSIALRQEQHTLEEELSGVNKLYVHVFAELKRVKSAGQKHRSEALTIQLSDLHSRKDTLKASIEANQNALAEMLDVAPASDRMLDRRASTQSADHVPPTGGRMMERRSSTQSADLHSKTKHMDLAAKAGHEEVKRRGGRTDAAWQRQGVGATKNPKPGNSLRAGDGDPVLEDVLAEWSDRDVAGLRHLQANCALRWSGILHPENKL